MAIEFGRSEYISRGKGGNAVRSAAYAMRKKLFDERLGVTHKFKDDGTLQHGEILLPVGADKQFLDVGVLFNAMERVEKRKDAQVARVIVVALDAHLSPDERIQMTRGFARQLFVDRGLPVLICIHSPHDGRNHHAHLIGGTRQLGPEGFAARKVRTTIFTKAFGRPFLLKSERERAGELWREFQNRWFSENGKGITVDPVGPVPQEHIGPVRFRAPNDHRIAHNEQVRWLNEQIASLQRETLEKACWADKVPSGLRSLSVDDIARELSPEYAKLVKRAAEIRDAIRKADWVRNRQDADKEAGAHRVNERRAEIGIVRRALHRTGAWRDNEIERWGHFEKRAEYTGRKWAIRRAALLGELDVVARRAAAELEKLRPAAQTALDQRQKVARNARAALENLEQRDKLVQRARRSYSRGPPL